MGKALHFKVRETYRELHVQAGWQNDYSSGTEKNAVKQDSTLAPKEGLSPAADS